MDYWVRSDLSPSSLIKCGSEDFGWGLNMCVTDKKLAHLISVWAGTENSMSGFLTEGVAHQAGNQVVNSPMSHKAIHPWAWAKEFYSSLGFPAQCIYEHTLT